MFQRVSPVRRVLLISVLAVICIVVFQGVTDSPGDDYRPPKETLEALALSREGKKEQAFELYTEQARQGDRFAQFAVGSMLARSDGVARDLERAIRWFRKAAQKGQPGAQYSLGRIYINEPKYRNLESAIDWFQLAATAEYPGAANQLGLIFERGNGVQKDERRAMSHFKDAAEFGSIHGVTNSARLLAESDADWASPEKRYKWLLILEALDGPDTAARERRQLEEAMSWVGRAHGWCAAQWWLFWHGDQFDG